jgi:hypothetical protein
MDEPLQVTVDGVSYLVSELSAEAQEQVNNLRFVDQEMAALRSRLALCGTARIAYENALRLAVPRSIQ